MVGNRPRRPSPHRPLADGAISLRSTRLRFGYAPQTGRMTLTTIGAPVLVAIEARTWIELIWPGGSIETRDPSSAALTIPPSAEPQGGAHSLIRVIQRTWPDGLQIVQRFELSDEAPELRIEASLLPPAGFGAALRSMVMLAPPTADHPNLVVSPLGRTASVIDFGWSAHEPARAVPLLPVANPTDESGADGYAPPIVATGLLALGSAEHGTTLTLGLVDGHQSVGTYCLRAPTVAQPGEGLILEARADFGTIALPTSGLRCGPLWINLEPLDRALQRFVELLVPGQPAQIERPTFNQWVMPSAPILPTEEGLLDSLSKALGAPAAAEIEVATIPGGWEESRGDWAADPARFPHGLRALRETIHAQRLRAGLTIDPFVASPSAALVKEHPNWLVRSSTGDPLAITTGSAGILYLLDSSQEAVCEWLKALGQRMRTDWGFGAAQLEHLEAEARSGWRQSGAASPLAAYRTGLGALREGLGDCTLVAAGAPFLASLGLVDVLQTDSRPLRRAEASPLLRCFLNRAGFQTSAGPTCLAAEGQTLEEARAAATVAALSGGVVTLIGDLGTLPAERSDTLLVCLPPFPGALFPLDPFAPDGPHLFGARIRRSWEEWLLLMVINPAAWPIALATSLDRLGLRGEQHAFEFWTQRYLGVITERLTLDQIPAGGCRVIALRPCRSEPQMVGTSLHVSQGGSEVHEIAFNRQSNSLQLAVGSPGDHQGTISIALPPGWHPGSVRGTGGNFQIRPISDRLIEVHLRFRDVANLLVDFWKTAEG